jgi:hypothetical protein
MLTINTIQLIKAGHIWDKRYLKLLIISELHRYNSGHFLSHQWDKKCPD